MSQVDLTSTICKLWEGPATDYILRKRFCDKHMRKFIEAKNVTNPKVNVVELLGICSKCHKAGVVYYLQGELK